MSAILPPPIGPDWRVWGQQLSTYLGRALSRMQFKVGNPTPSENGILLWDDVAGYPVVSKDGEFRQLIMEGGNYSGRIASNVTAASANTAYYLTYTTVSGSTIALDPTYPERIVFSRAGEFLINFSVQISTAASSAISFYFWPRINGVDVAASTLSSALKTSQTTINISRSAIFQLNAGDYLEVMWAVDDTNGFLDATAATAFCPSSPASTIGITRVHG